MDPSSESKKRLAFTKYAQTASLDEIERLEALLEAAPENREILDWLAFAYYSHQMLDKAIHTYRRLIQMVPDNAGYHYYLGNSLYQTGNGLAARVEWEKVVALDEAGQFQRSVREKIAAVDEEG